jgi:hypothetical protein
VFQQWIKGEVANGFQSTSLFILYIKIVVYAILFTFSSNYFFSKVFSVNLTPMKTILILAFALLISFTMHSQDAVTASGGEGSGSGGTFSFALGQVLFTTASDSDGSISHGVHQGAEINSLSNPELKTVILKAVTYPNPTTDYVILNVTDPDLINLSYTLINFQGKVLSNRPIVGSDTEIPMQSLSVGVYVLQVNQNNIELKTFQIIKK